MSGQGREDVVNYLCLLLHVSIMNDTYTLLLTVYSAIKKVTKQVSGKNLKWTRG